MIFLVISKLLKGQQCQKTNIFVFLSLQELDGCLEIHVADVLALGEGEDEVVVAMTRPVLHLLLRKRCFYVEIRHVVRWATNTQVSSVKHLTFPFS